MNHTEHTLTQGSAEWHAYRAQMCNASEAAQMLGISPHGTRSDLLLAKHTGLTADPSYFQQKVYAGGHRVEAANLPNAERFIGEELYPAVCSLVVDGVPLSCSYDGTTLGDLKTWEQKQANKENTDAMLKGEIPVMYHPQCEQNLMVIGAEICYFCIGDEQGNPENFICVPYRSNPVLRQQILAGWKQFLKDLETFVPPVDKPRLAGNRQEALPALQAEVVGEVKSSNLEVFRQSLTARVQSMPDKLETDQDFADARENVRWLEDGEKKIKLFKEIVLSQTKDIDKLFSGLDAIADSMRAKRLNTTNQIDTESARIRAEILKNATTGFAKHLDELNQAIGEPIMPPVPVDFVKAMKGKRTVATLRDAVDTCMATAKIEADAIARRISINLKFMRDQGDYAFLFADKKTIVQKAADDFELLVNARIEAHKAQEKKREDDRLAKVAADKKKADDEQQAREEREAAEADRKRVIALQEQAPAPSPAPVDTVTAPAPEKVATGSGLPQRSGVPPRPMPAPAAAQPRPTRPTDSAIIDALALHFRVHESKVIEWLLEMDLEAASANLVREL